MGTGEGQGRLRGKEERIAVPAMPMPLAVLCCILNFLIPGLGTIIGGFSACCCSRNEDLGGAQKCGSCCISFGIGFLQLLLTLCIVGWIWSCVWGVFFVGMSASYYHGNKTTDSNNAGNVVTTQPQTYAVVTSTNVIQQVYAQGQPQFQPAYGHSQQHPQMQGQHSRYAQPQQQQFSQSGRTQPQQQLQPQGQYSGYSQPAIYQVQPSAPPEAYPDAPPSYSQAADVTHPGVPQQDKLYDKTHY